LDLITRNAWYQDYYLNLRGGDATSKYSLNAGYSDMQGVVRGVDANRLSARFNLEFRISPKISAGLHIGFNRTKKNLMDQGYEERVNPLYLSLVKPPILAPYQISAEGINEPFFSQPDYDGISNPLAVTAGVTNDILNTWILGNVFAQYDFSRTLKTRVTLSLDRRGLEEDRFTPSNGIVPDHGDLRFDRIAEKQLMKSNMMSIEHVLTFTKPLNTEHWLRVFGGYNFEFGSFNSEFGTTIHSTSDDFKSLGDGQKYAMGGVDDIYRNISFFTNADYTYREKILITAGIRADGTSRFGNKNPFAVLPYLGATWRLKSISFLNNISVLDAFNLRGSWGLSANQDVPYTARYSLYNIAYYTNRPGAIPYTTGDSDIRWESTNTFNLGIDASLFNKWLNIRLDYFNSTTTDLLVPTRDNLDKSQIFSWSNGGTLKNNGVELAVSTLGKAGGFVWNAGFNIAVCKTQVSDLPYEIPLIEGENGFSSIVANGEEPGLIYGYKNLGVFSRDEDAAGLLNDKGIPYKGGDFHFQDVNNDRIINELDLQIIGNPNPDFYGGVTAGVTYSRFSLDALFSYSYGNDILNVLRMKMENASGYENQSKAILNRWQMAGDKTTLAHTEYGDPAGNRSPSSYYIEDGSWLKLKTITLSYNIEKKFSFIRYMQVYLTGLNLFSIHNYLGWDPETAVGHNVFTRGYDFGNQPLPRMYMVGIKIGL
jgi:TonB-linked SusC/RagA family outer membrane protein